MWKRRYCFRNLIKERCRGKRMPMENSEGESGATTKPRKARSLQGTRQLAMSDLAEDTGFKIAFRIWQHDWGVLVERKRQKPDFTGGGIGRSEKEDRADADHGGIELYVLSSNSTQFRNRGAEVNYSTDFAK